MQSPYMQGLALTRKMNHTYNTNTQTNRISQTSIPLNTSGERKTEKERERGKKWWSRTWTSNNKQSIKSVGERVGGAGGGKADIGEVGGEEWWEFI